MNIIELLKEDHKQVADLFEQLLETTERAVKTREELFGKILDALDLHTQFEEKRFYPTLKQEDKTEDLTREAYEEHHVIKTLLAEIGGMEPSDPQWLAKATVLEENVTHHVQEEEKELFPKAKSIYSSEELESLGKEYQDFKKQQ